MRRIAILILLVADLTYAAIVGSYAKPAVDYYIKEPRLIRASYVSEITGKSSDKDLVKKYLDIFNSYGHNNIVKYEPQQTSPRTITIAIRKLNETFYEDLNGAGLMGYALPGTETCRIIIRDDIKTEQQFKLVLLHEFLHCYFYDHSTDKDDLMYYTENVVSEENIKSYAREIETRIQ